MPIKYIYLDDEDENIISPFVNEVVSANNQLQIEHRHPGEYSEQITGLENEEFDGLILDLRLDQYSEAENPRSKYRGTTFAQELRTRATEEANNEHLSLGDFPIVLWSMDERLRQSFYYDYTGHDLFDLKCRKEDIQDSEKSQKIADQLVSLPSGYEKIKEVTSQNNANPVLSLQKLLGFDCNPTFIDPRILHFFDNRKSGIIPSHEYARFIIKDLLEFPGPLIDEQLLLTRLGIDQQKSTNDAIQKLLQENLKSCRYTGIFGDGWPRWWSYLIDNWWRESGEATAPQRSMAANQRVQFLTERTGIQGLVDAKPIKSEYSADFWVICQVTNKPLSPRDGIIIKTKSTKPWQDKLYINKGAALRGSYKQKGLIIDPLEEERLKNLKKQSHREIK